MNWYKKSQQEIDWNRFARDFPGVPWKSIFYMKIGNPSLTIGEKRKVINLGLIDEVVNPNDPKQFPELREKTLQPRKREYELV